MRIEEITKEKIEKVTGNELYQLRLRSRQFFEKYTAFEKKNLFINVDWGAFFNGYTVLMVEFNIRKLSFNNWVMDDVLETRVSKMEDFQIEVIGSMAEAKSSRGNHFCLLLSRSGKNVLIDPAVHKSKVSKSIDGVFITHSDKDHWAFVKEYSKAPVYTIGAILDSLPPNDFHPIMKSLGFDGFIINPIKTSLKAEVKSMGIKVDFRNVEISILPEFMSLSKEAENLITKTIWIMGCGEFEKDDIKHNKLSFLSLMKLAERLKPKAVYLTNLREDIFKHEEEVNALLEKWNGKLLKDGVVLNMNDFQKRVEKLEINALAVEKFQLIKDKKVINEFNYSLAVGEVSKECADAIEKTDNTAIIEYENKYYNVIGISNNTNQNVAMGSVVTVVPEEISKCKTADDNYFYFKTKSSIIERSAEDKTVPDKIEALEKYTDLLNINK